ncbi:saccharopine dehydrogenase family protein [Natronogracilivirga saccharolytica]|uniref:Saccharopine dehydrogenase NADP-binding domain-containing protein n=1 Tax=Natronogracilivirga saccharolytica TaxID=2812953 RepID=A0A8J7UWM5_9BACT|nr:saccharopine dehydrogenase C-terminal domain-containing protein [Natronogracilivirga saccharolytica]MBP3193787.1 saccharopine dehydrogenase NADP-binding domain-containing protein [Natronogracilivirga saccharolytica]
MKIAVIGAGPAGSAITRVLMDYKEVQNLVVLDRNGAVLDELKESFSGHPSLSRLRTFRVGMQERSSIITLVNGFDVMISALPYQYNLEMTKIAIETGSHFLDLGGNDKVFEMQRKLDKQAEQNGSCILPNCGLAPGLLNIIAMNGFRQFETVSSIEMMSGGLPVNPHPPLNHHLSFSAEAFLSEHLPPVLAVRDGRPVDLEPMSGLEPITFQSRPEMTALETFYTGGHISTLAYTLQGSVSNLSYKTIRHRGNHSVMQALIELGLADDRIIDIGTSMTYKDFLIRKLRKRIPENLPDIVLAKVIIDGQNGSGGNSKKLRRTYELTYEYHPDDGHSAVMSCTALPTAHIALMLARGEISARPGVHPPEQIVPAESFLDAMKQYGIEISIHDSSA